LEVFGGQVVVFELETTGGNRTLVFNRNNTSPRDSPIVLSFPRPQGILNGKSFFFSLFFSFFFDEHGGGGIGRKMNDFNFFMFYHNSGL
jgi:hypothetical protein